MSCPHPADSGVGSSPCHPDMGLDPGTMGALAVPAALRRGEASPLACVCREHGMAAVPGAAEVRRVPGRLSGVLDH